MSKINDTDDWGIDFESFFHITSTYGEFSIDRFANDDNKKCDKFNSLHYCRGTNGIDAFSFNWKNDFNWLCPPISLIGKTIRHLKHCKAKGVLFLPEWKSAYFWPLITQDGKHFKSFIKHYISLDP